MSMPPKFGIMLRIGPQRRLGDPVEEVADRPHQPVARIEHAEGDEHAEYRRQDDRPAVQAQYLVENLEDDRDHGGAPGKAAEASRARNRSATAPEYPAGRPGLTCPACSAAFCAARDAPRRAPAQDGAVAQLGERLVRNEEVRGSIPLSSTTCPAVSAVNEIAFGRADAFAKVSCIRRSGRRARPPHPFAMHRVL